jgi:hypothetical protein
VSAVAVPSIDSSCVESENFSCSNCDPMSEFAVDVEMDASSIMRGTEADKAAGTIFYCSGASLV